ncbi:MAG: RecQ family ATP-dependent DNA helicase [Bifidobacteriaceae bacterium]|nr:RecQ family ATP-dependent DNA helicase [Bifidobacteriaceae bacterium]
MESEATRQAVEDKALGVLRTLTGRADAVFHADQWEAIAALVLDGRRALVVQKTGWGKSAVYFIASLLLRERGRGPALIVSPLLALMRDQVAAAEKAGVRAATINSANPMEWEGVERRLQDGSVDVLLISPERLVNRRFQEQIMPDLLESVGLVVIDEAHCISDWGHDFRPDYRRIGGLLRQLPRGTPVLATTATANSRVVADVEEQLAQGDHDVHTVRGALARPSLRLGVLRLDHDWQRLAWLAEHLDDLPGSGIVYCLTVAAAQDTADFSARSGHQTLLYTGRTDDAERQAAEQALKQNQVKALVATSALGMGFDKPDLGFVVHLGGPSSPVAYYQQVGRAGRATPNADVLLLPGSADRAIWKYFATASMPTQETADAVMAALAGADGPLSSPALEARVNIRRGKLELLLKVLSVEGAVESVPGGWALTGEPWHYDKERYERVAAARRNEQEAMIAYQGLGSCRMEFLTKALDDPHSEPCGHCDNCAGPWFEAAVGEGTGRAARDELGRVGVAIEPRALWPTGLDRLLGAQGLVVKGRIAVEERVEPGRVVARLTDLGWGGVLRGLFAADSEGRPIDADLPDSLAEACWRVLRDWDWHARPVAVVSVPSLSRPRLVASLADRIARVGRLENLGPLSLTGGAEPLAGSSNSAYRARDLWGRFHVPSAMATQLAELDGPVLLVDDLIDSRWTIAVAGRLLRAAGAPSVLPFALASAG